MISLVRTSLGVLAAALLFAAGSASAVSFPLNVEFDDGLVGSFGSVTVTENAGDLDFVISLTATLGAGADLHEFYFNLAGSPTGVAISSTQVVATAFSLALNPPVTGGAGSSFEYGVNFGNGAGGPGNGVLKTANFTISANEALTLASLSPTSSTSQDIVVNFAAHVQGTSFVAGSTSETVGGVVPEPSTAGLLVLGLAALASRRRGMAAKR